MKKPIVFMFSGQGSHFYQMGQELYQHAPLFRDWMNKADRVYRGLTGLSVIEQLYQSGYKKSDPFSRTLLTHPAIFMVQYALAQELLAKDILPDLVLGTSLGEFAAATLAGILSFETALEAVIKQAELIEKTCKQGSMIAVFHNPSLYEHPFIKSYSEIASFNFPEHFVLSGEKENLKKVEDDIKQHQISYQVLNVSHGFHSSSIDPAVSDYLDFIQKQSFEAPKIPFISCVYSKTTLPRPEHFWQIIKKPILFQTTVQNLETTKAYSYIDVGPSGTLATFIKYNLSQGSNSKVFRTLSPFGTSASFLDILKENLNQ